MQTNNHINLKLVKWILRISIAGEFFGHGVFALQGKRAWVGWFSTFAIQDAALATKLLFMIGLLDIILAILVLIKPVIIAILWMTIFGGWIAILRPIVGESIWDFVERWANWGAPLTLFLLLGSPKQPRDWLHDK